MTDNVDLKDCLTPAQTAKELRVTYGTLANWRVSGEGPRFIKKRSRHIYYEKAEVERFKNSIITSAGSSAEWKSSGIVGK